MTFSILRNKWNCALCIVYLPLVFSASSTFELAQFTWTKVSCTSKKVSSSELLSLHLPYDFSTSEVIHYEIFGRRTSRVWNLLIQPSLVFRWRKILWQGYRVSKMKQLVSLSIWRKKSQQSLNMDQLSSCSKFKCYALQHLDTSWY